MVHFYSFFLSTLWLVFSILYLVFSYSPLASHSSFLLRSLLFLYFFVRLFFFSNKFYLVPICQFHFCIRSFLVGYILSCSFVFIPPFAIVFIRSFSFVFPQSFFIVLQLALVLSLSNSYTLLTSSNCRKFFYSLFWRCFVFFGPVVKFL